MNLTNNHNLSLPLAILLAHDTYDHNNDIKTISATFLLKPTRSIVLSLQNKKLDKEIDLSDLAPSTFGTAIHEFAESGWNNKKTLKKAMTALGIADEIQERVVINPTNPTDKDIPIYVEKRSSRRIAGWTITGKFDVVVNGRLSDYKITSVWGHMFDSDSDNYSKQGSIYKWLNSNIITDNVISIEKVFSDWQASKAKYDKNYPALRMVSTEYPLMSMETIEIFILDKLKKIDTCLPLTKSNLPLCNDDELWASGDVWKYYKKVGAKRATKNYTNSAEAYARQAADGGEVKEFPGEVKRCKYCNVVEICDQAKALTSAGRLKL